MMCSLESLVYSDVGGARMVSAGSWMGGAAVMLVLVLFGVVVVVTGVAAAVA